MIKTNFDRAWRLKVLDPLTLKMSEGTPVDLPHDYSITQKMDKNTFTTASNAFLPGGVIEYEKSIYVPEEWSGKKIILEFEGVYMNAIVRVNDSIVTRHPYGYTSFHSDLTPLLKFGEENKITVNVNNQALPNSRWYSGMGIYRHVWLMVLDTVHIDPWGIFVTTPTAEQDYAVLDIKTKLNNISENGETVVLKQTLKDASGKELTETEMMLTMLPNSTEEKTQTLKLNDAKLWSPDTPYLYKLTTEVIRNDNVICARVTNVGIRKISVDVRNGFMLNGETLKMKGGCVHHDCGILGSAAYDRAERRKVERLKESGYNAIRCAHNPPSPVFLDACDEIGMLVMDEAFDCWNEPKMTNDYSLFFAGHWQTDMRSMLERDRNHPSIIMWSTGNEIPERDGRSDGYAVAKELADFVRGIDNTRPVTNALCDIWGAFTTDEDKKKEYQKLWGEKTKDFAAPLDVAGYNYLLDRYEGDGERFPDRIIVGTETFPKDALDYWNAVEKLPYVIGDFVWTSMDYLGEAGIGRVLREGETTFVGEYPWSHANCGDIDICGFKRPQSYYRDCVWGESKAPYIAVHNPVYECKEQKITNWGWPEVYPCWTWHEYAGKKVRIDVYSADEEVELFLNNKSLGRKPAGKDNRYIASFELAYEPGELTAVGLKDGKEVSRTTLVTGGEPIELCLTPDREKLSGGFGDLCYVTVTAKDKDGNVADNSDKPVYLTVSGAGSLLAVGSSNPKTEEMFVGNTRNLYFGKAMCVVRADGTGGEITVTASAEGMKTAVVKINA